MRLATYAGLLLICCAAAPACFAAATQFSTFATLAYSRTDSQAIDYRLAPNYLYSVDNNWSSVLDSRLGLQARVALHDELNLVGQLLLRRNSVDDAQWTTPWAYVHWQPHTQYEWLLGRFRHSLFMITDEIDVGYAWPWVRPPVELYSLVAESNFVDGVKMRYRTTLGRFTAVAETHFGQLRLDRRPRLRIDNDKNYGLAFSLSDGLVTYRAALVQAQVTLRSERLDQLLNVINQQAPWVGADYSVSDISPQRFLNVGLRYEDGNWLVLSEASRLWLRSRLLPDKWAYYLTIGHTWQDFTPFLTIARQQMASFEQETRLSGNAAAAISQFEQTALTNQATLSAGVRWELAAGAALKIQFDRVHQPTGSAGTRGALLPVGRQHYVVSTLSLDWVY